MKYTYFLGLCDGPAKNGGRWYAAYTLKNDRWGNPIVKRAYMTEEMYKGCKIPVGAPVKILYNDDDEIDTFKVIEKVPILQIQ